MTDCAWGILALVVVGGLGFAVFILGYVMGYERGDERRVRDVADDRDDRRTVRR